MKYEARDDRTAKRFKLSDDEIVTTLEEMNRTAVGYLSDEVSGAQDDNLDRYLGRPYGDEEEGRSTAMSMDVAEVVDWGLPDILEPFVSGDKAVEFEPSTQKDEQYCGQATDLVHHVFWTENNGFLVLYDTVKTAMIQRLGVIKTVWRDEEKVTTERLEGITLLHLQELQAEDGVTVDEIEADPAPAEVAAIYPDGQMYECTVTRASEDGCIRVMSVPPEEIKVSQRAASLEGIEYVAHECEKTRSDLIGMGFDADVVMSLSSDRQRDTDRQDVRFRDENRREEVSRKKAGDILTLIEEYPLIDVDDDGKLERLQVFRVGKTILEKEIVEDHPFEAWSADRIPHRLIGLGVADKVKQTQYIKTHLTRQLLDNVYLANNPRTEVPEAAQLDGGETIEDLLTLRIGGLIRTKQPGMLTPIVTPDRSASTLQTIMYMDGVREQQSGITRNGSALDSEALDPKSATQVRKEDRNELARKRLMARMLAETLLVPVFRRILKHLVRYQQTPKWIKLRDNWVAMDPRGWNADLRARPSVGLGYANRDELTQAAMMVLGVQEKAVGLGLAQPQHLYAAAEQLIKAVGWRNPEKYFMAPNSPEAQAKAAQPPPPDPKMVEVQTKAQLAQMQAQYSAQLNEMDLQTKMREAAAKAETDKQMAAVKAESERQIAQMRLQSEAQIATLRMMMEERLAIRKQDMEQELSARELDISAKSNGANGANGHANMGGGSVRFGGNIG